jgi:hypothetical protein
MRAFRETQPAEPETLTLVEFIKFNDAEYADSFRTTVEEALGLELSTVVKPRKVSRCPTEMYWAFDAAEENPWTTTNSWLSSCRT